MTHIYLPEGRRLGSPANRRAMADTDGLTQAIRSGHILESLVLRCTPEHDLLVEVGPFTGVIPRCEAALGIAEGSTREIAILSRVGRPVSFVVTSLDTAPDGTLRPILSRRLAQQRVLDHYLSQLRPGDILPATVTHLESFGAFVDIGCGLVSMIGVDRISISRIPHPSARFHPGQEIFAVVSGLDPVQRRILLSHRELLGTWPENAAQFAPGMTVPGHIRGVRDYGLFIELAPNLSGLAEYQDGFQDGDRVSVYIKSILPERMKLKLLVIDRLPPLDAPEPPRYFHTQGHLSQWRYAPEGCLKAGAVTEFDPPD